MKSTVEEIRARFDKDVERFSNLDTGQSATIDAPLALELIAEAAAATTPRDAGDPPTATGLPRSSGRSRCSTDA